MRALSMDPEARPASALAFASDVAASLTGAPAKPATL
jgi:hypothetical protein